eukprot:929717-Lingulodinium_polyedra.AAC.1
MARPVLRCLQPRALRRTTHTRRPADAARAVVKLATCLNGTPRTTCCLAKQQISGARRPLPTSLRSTCHQTHKH